MQKVDLCEECAKTKGVNDPAAFSLADLLLGLGASQEIEQAGGDYQDLLRELEDLSDEEARAMLAAEQDPL